jgi:hypothetical protein
MFLGRSDEARALYLKLSWPAECRRRQTLGDRGARRLCGVAQSRAHQSADGRDREVVHVHGIGAATTNVASRTSPAGIKDRTMRSVPVNPNRIAPPANRRIRTGGLGQRRIGRRAAFADLKFSGCDPSSIRRVGECRSWRIADINHARSNVGFRALKRIR